MAATRKAQQFDAAKLRALRLGQGWSRRALADRCPNVSDKAIQAYEEARSLPEVNRALELASALNVPLARLLS